jgi:acetyl-CoA synthetase
LGKLSVPREIVIVPSLPKTRSGTIMRRVLKAKELGQDSGDISTLEEKEDCLGGSEAGSVGCK